MNPRTSSGDPSRRSFIKTSMVAAVAVSSMTIFSGLVNASTESSSPSNAVECSGEGCTWKGGPKTPGQSTGTCQNVENQDCTCTWTAGNKDADPHSEEWKDHWNCNAT